MTLTKASIIEIVSAENGWTAKQSSEYVDLLIEIMKSTLASGEDTPISRIHCRQVMTPTDASCCNDLVTQEWLKYKKAWSRGSKCCFGQLC